MSEEPWDELMGPPPTARAPLVAPAPFAPPPPVPVRSNSSNSTPPSAMFQNQSSFSGSVRSQSSGGAPPPDAFNASGSAISLPIRWSQYEADPNEAEKATANAVYMASAAAARRESQRSNFEDEDMSTEDAYCKEFGVGASDDEDDDDEEAIGKEYDSVHHDSIRQEALRMLEVADADQHYSVHRTITGGFSAQARTLGTKKPKALSGLSFIASRSNKMGKHLTDFTNPRRSSSTSTREDFEYGDHNVVDVIGMEQRAAGNAATTSDEGNWSSRYSIDNTLLAMSGGIMKMSSSERERLTANNLFAKSPTKSTDVFGSGFSFRQKYVFGKQGVNANLHQPWMDANGLDGTLSSNGSKLKTWQEQLLHKKRQQRRLLLFVCALLLCIILPLAFVTLSREQLLRHKTVLVPADGTHGSVTFYVTADVPINDAEQIKLRHDLALIVPTTSFAVHLGNIQDASLDGCPIDQYKTVAELLEKSSPRTVFIVPGQEDWNNCPNPDDAWDAWSEQFDFFEARWSNVAEKLDFDVMRQRSEQENWAFIHRGVLFVGVHAVNGNVVDQEEFDSRNKNNYDWVSSLATSHKQDIRSLVIFGNAKPGYPETTKFFAPLEAFMRTFDLPTLYVHASSISTGVVKEHHPFFDAPLFTALQVNTGVDSPPLEVNVGFGENPFIFG